MKNLINEMKVVLESIGNRADHIEARNLEMIQVKKERTKVF